MVGTIIMALTFWAGLCVAANLTDLEKLGGLIYRDKNLSIGENQSCMTCHHPSAGFADPENRRNPINFPVSDGSDPTLFGGRNAPTAAYAGFSPKFHKDASGTYVGGMFWDGRATGERLGDPLAEQALGPFLNPVEMALTIYDVAGEPTDDPSEVVARVKTAKYARLFEKVFLNDLNYNWKGWDSDVYKTYDLIGIAIAADIQTAAFLSLDRVAEWAPILEDETIPKRAHDVKRFMREMTATGVELRGLDIDTALAAYLVDPAARSFELRDLVDRYLGIEVESPDREESGAGQSAFDFAGGPDLESAGRRAVALGQLAEVLMVELDKRNERRLFDEIEMPLMSHHQLWRKQVTSEVVDFHMTLLGSNR